MQNSRTKKRYAFPANPQGKSTAVIPHGGFCEDCPYWHRNPLKPRQEGGFCTLLNVADWHRREVGLLWDGVKVCGYNLDRQRLRFGQRRRWEAILARPSLMTLRKPFPSVRGPGWRTKFRDAA